MRRRTKRTELETRLGYTFKNRELFKRALTHASVRSHRGTRHDNERLESSETGCWGSPWPTCFRAAPRRQRRRACPPFQSARAGADLCSVDGLGLGHIFLSESEAESGGREKETILPTPSSPPGGFIEAGFETARKIVRSLWSDQIDAMPHAIPDPKSALQEWAQGQGLSLPEYIEISRSGPDHAPRFVTEVHIAGREPARGEGPTKRQAEQAAASSLLAREGVRLEAIRRSDAGLKKSSHG